MRAEKEAIRKSFSQAAPTYDKYSGVQRDIARGVVNYIKALLGSKDTVDEPDNFIGLTVPGVKGLTVLDIGCGTGSLLSLIRDEYPDSDLYGCDIALPMLEEARKNLGPGPRLTAGDCEALPFSSSVFDIAASSLTYQWVKDTVRAFKEVRRVLAPEGLFVFSTLGPDTLSEFRGCFKEAAGIGTGLMDFLDAEALSKSIEKAGFDLVGIQGYKVFRKYPSMRELLRTLKGIGASPPSKEPSEGLSMGTALKRTEALYAERFPADTGGVIATYDVIYAAARKI